MEGLPIYHMFMYTAEQGSVRSMENQQVFALLAVARRAFL